MPGISLVSSSAMSKFLFQEDVQQSFCSCAGFLTHLRNVVENKIVPSAMAF